MKITFSSCFYIIKSKFEPNVYVQWMNNFISIVNNFYLVIYTDINSINYIDTHNNKNIKIIIKPLEQFYNYKYKDYWLKNHEKNSLLNNNSSWQLNMLWSEKIPFVKETIQNKYFDTEIYGWCDIGYFRNRPIDTHTSNLSNWGNNTNFLIKNPNKICYGCIKNDEKYINYLFNLVHNRNDKNLPINPIPHHQNSIAGGFFLLNKNNIDWWSKIYDDKLKLYFENNYLVKDDQIILVTDKGQIIRVNVSQIRIAGRSTKGVSVFKIPEGDSIVSVSRIPDIDT